MPPMIPDADLSDQSSGLEDVIPPKKAAKGKQKAKPAQEQVDDGPDDVQENEDDQPDKDEEEEDDDDDEEAEEYVVERILDHDFEADGTLKYQVKWAGYESEADRTWEPLKNLSGAAEILAAYHKKIGGKPVHKPSTPAAKARGRGKRKSQPAQDTPDLASSATSKKRKTNGSTDRDLNLPVGSWEDDIESITTLEQSDVTIDGKDSIELIGLLQWNDGKNTRHSIALLRQKCPQKLLDYLLGKLIFKLPSPQTPRALDSSLSKPHHDEAEEEEEEGES